jgi:hypothetical protein
LSPYIEPERFDSSNCFAPASVTLVPTTRTCFRFLRPLQLLQTGVGNSGFAQVTDGGLKELARVPRLKTLLLCSADFKGRGNAG